ncbi:MAG: recombinase family protein [Planctomycetes bacterium]|nr:recombinase family protein [Planctomycetota bacterium]
MNKFTAIYLRVSTAQQTTRGQKADLKRWIEAQSENGRVVWFEDKATGKNMDRPGWNKLQASIIRGEVDRLIVWRLDRLGRTASGLCKLFEDLQAHKVRLISLKDSIDLGTPSGRLIANVLASVAAYETEVRGERVKAGQDAARDAGKRWGGSEKGRLISINPEQVKTIIKLRDEGQKISHIARSVNVNRSSVYRVLDYIAKGYITA